MPMNSAIDSANASSRHHTPHTATMATSSSAAPKEIRTVRFGLAEERTNPFVGNKICLSGFEPIQVTIARDKNRKAEKAAAKAAKKNAREADFIFNSGNDNYKPLQRGESFWIEDMSHTRRHNIIGGWA